MASYIGRRKFLAALGGAAAWPVAARAQQPAMPVIGLLSPGSKIEGKRFFDGFPAGMQERGYFEGRDYVLESRYGEGEIARLPLLAQELIRLKPSVIVCGTNFATLVTKQITTSIPIVAVNLVDPVGNGMVNSEARPGTNITGTLQYLEGLTGKQLELIRDLVPGAAKIGILASINEPESLGYQRREVEAAAAKLGMSLMMAEVRAANEVGPAFQTCVRERVDVVFVLRSAMFLAMRRQIAAFALVSRMPTIYTYREYVESGGLTSYGIDLRDSYRRAAYFVDKILKGQKPADLPIEFPTKLELVINLATAKALGLTVPPTLLARADEVIE